MHNSKFLASLRKLSVRQLSRFGEFLASPYFNKATSNVTFFEHLRQYGPDFTHPDLSKEALLRDWPLEGEATEKKLAYAISSLQGLLEQFLGIDALISDPLAFHLQMLEAGAEQKQDRPYRALFSRARKMLEAFPWQNAEYYAFTYQLARIDYHRQQDPNRHAYDEFLQKTSEALDVYYLLEKLRYSLAMVNLEAMLSISYDHHLEDALLAALEEGPYLRIPAVAMYRSALALLRDGQDVAAFFGLRQKLQESGALLPPAERKLLYTALLNFCTRRINRFADERFRAEYLDINILLLEDDLLLEEGGISPWRYLNLFTTALRIGRSAWALEFIHAYRQKLPAEYADNLFLFCQGHYHYHHQEYGQAMKQLALVEFQDLLFNLSLRSLLTRVYYEASEEELLFNYLEANRLFLIRNELIDGVLRRQMQNFVDFTRKLARIGRHDKQKLPELRAQLPPPDEIMHREWLLNQIDHKMTRYR